MLFMLEFLSNSQTNQHCKAHPAGEEQKGQGRWDEVLCRVFAAKYLPIGHFNIPRGGVCVFWQCLVLPVPWAAPWSCLAFPATHCLQPQRPHLSRARSNFRKITIKKRYVRNICEIITRSWTWSSFHLGALCEPQVVPVPC